VIASGSSLALKGAGVGPKDAARQLGVRYVLEGSVRKSANRVRIAVQLVDANDGTQMWSHRFDDTIDDVFDLQDKVALSVAGAIEPTVLRVEMGRASARPTENMGSYDLFLRGLALQRVYTKAGMSEALDCLHRAVALDPDYAAAQAQAAFEHFLMADSAWSDDPDFHRRSSVEFAQRALKSTTDDPVVLAVAGFIVSRLDQDQEAAIALLERAIALNPGSSVVWGFSGVVHAGYDDADLAISHLETAARLDPIGPERAAWIGWMGIAQFQQGRFREAVANLREWVQQSDIYLGHGFMAAGYGHLGQLDAAREALTRYRSTTPLPIADLANSFPNLDFRRLYQEGIALAEGQSTPEIPVGTGHP
jgi:Flp pilus assembly protein TadD